VIDFEIARKHLDAEAARIKLQSNNWVDATLEGYDSRFESAKNSLTPKTGTLNCYTFTITCPRRRWSSTLANSGSGTRTF
jgi:hypothetical protein